MSDTDMSQRIRETERMRGGSAQFAQSVPVRDIRTQDRLGGGRACPKP